MQITDFVVHERNVGVHLVNVKTEHCKTRVKTLANFSLFYSHTHDVSVGVPLILPKLLIAIFNYFFFFFFSIRDFQILPLVSFIKYFAHTQAEKLNIRQY